MPRLRGCSTITSYSIQGAPIEFIHARPDAVVQLRELSEVHYLPIDDVVDPRARGPAGSGDSQGDVIDAEVVDEEKK